MNRNAQGPSDVPSIKVITLSVECSMVMVYLCMSASVVSDGVARNREFFVRSDALRSGTVGFLVTYHTEKHGFPL